MKIKNKRIMIILGLILFVTAWVLFFRWVNPKIAVQQKEGTVAKHDTLVDSSMIDTPVGSGSSTMDFELKYETRSLKVGQSSRPKIWATVEGQEYNWSSSNPSVVKLETIPAPNKGHMRYLVAVSAGTAEITATCGPNSHSITITVTDSSLDFTLSCKTELNVGEEIGIQASNHDQEYTWTTSDSSVVSISNSPHFSGSYAKMITGKKAGTATITATSGSKSKSVTITVTGSGSSGGGSSDDAVVTYTHSVDKNTIEPGGMATVTFTPELLLGSALPSITYSHKITWSDPTVSGDIVVVNGGGTHNQFYITGVQKRTCENRILC